MLLARRSQSGFYLLETLIVFIILAIGLLALSQLHGTLMGYTSLVKQRVEASEIGKAKLEELRNYQCLTTAACAFAYADIATGTSTQTGSNATYSLSWTVTTHTNPTYKIVNLTVTWTSSSNVSESINLSTVIAANDPSGSGKLFNTS